MAAVLETVDGARAIIIRLAPVRNSATTRFVNGPG